MAEVRVVGDDNSYLRPSVLSTSAKQDTAKSVLDTIDAVLDTIYTRMADGNQKVQVSGSITTLTHTAVNATVATGEVLAANANRKYALLVNDSDTTVYIKIGAAAVLNQGIRLNANGGSYEMSNALGNLNTGAINGIHGGAGNKAVLVTEGV